MSEQLPNDPLVVGVDFGGTHLRAALVKPDGTILEQLKRETQSHLGPEKVVARIVEAVEDMVKHAPEGSDVAALGVIAPGPLDPFKGIIYNAPNLPGWEEVSLADELTRRVALPVWLGNDANLAALAEHRYGAGVGFRNMIYITVSTGVGTGFIVNDQLVLGEQGLAGEGGHMIILPDGPLCNCGNRGCVEALASGTNIAIEAQARLERGMESSLSTRPKPLTAIDVTQAAMAGDPMATHTIARAGYYLGIAIANLSHLFNPGRFVIGGGVSNAGELLLGPARRSAVQHLMLGYRDSLDIVLAKLGDNVGLLGAAALAFTHLEPLPRAQ
ncbi:MAG: ROK family protein [Anaerolineales bacterium]|nr:ROK family protein [Anaerolineales bacterium]MCB9127050.1 ROK family protein [Ardenticatenales bacterium]MCB9172426.1 ROK family protein [Ardenticatenales bacterium]